MASSTASLNNTTSGIPKTATLEIVPGQADLVQAWVQEMLQIAMLLESKEADVDCKVKSTQLIEELTGTFRKKLKLAQVVAASNDMTVNQESVLQAVMQEIKLKLMYEVYVQVLRACAANEASGRRCGPCNISDFRVKRVAHSNDNLRIWELFACILERGIKVGSVVVKKDKDGQTTAGPFKVHSITSEAKLILNQEGDCKTVEPTHYWLASEDQSL